MLAHGVRLRSSSSPSLSVFSFVGPVSAQQPIASRLPPSVLGAGALPACPMSIHVSHGVDPVLTRAFVSLAHGGMAGARWAGGAGSLTRAAAPSGSAFRV